MQLEEVKMQMSVLEQILARTSHPVDINISASETAKDRILKKYRQAIVNNLILGIVFGCLWYANVSPEKLPGFCKAYISVMCLLAAGWYTFLYRRLKGVEIARLKPVKLFYETTRIKTLTLSGEVAFGLALAVFFTLLLSFLIVNSQLAFWLIIGFLALSLAIAIIYTWPRYIKLFKDLATLK